MEKIGLSSLISVQGIINIIGIMAFILGIWGVGFAYYISVTRPKKQPTPNIHLLHSIQRANREQSEKVGGYDNWLTVYNTGDFIAHNVIIEIFVPIGQKINPIEARYFTIDKDKKEDERVVLIGVSLSRNFLPPPIYFFTTGLPTIKYQCDEQTGAIPMPVEYY